VTDILIAAAAIVVIIAIIAFLVLHLLREDDKIQKADDIEEGEWLERMTPLTHTGELRFEDEQRQWWRERDIEAHAAIIVSTAEMDSLLESGFYAQTPWTRNRLEVHH
jgi:hypothetical protein